LKDLHNKEVDKFLSKSPSSTILHVNSVTISEINKKSIILFGEDFTKKIIPVKNTQSSYLISIDRIKTFFSKIKDSLVRLNHLGISYSCSSIVNEIAGIKKLLQGTNFKLYEEPADLLSQRWFFIGNFKNWKYPLFELVMTESNVTLCTKKLPHFQIDIDTKLTTNEIEFLTKKYLKDGFINWKLNIPNFGIVLEMGELGNISGVKICLGLGTNLRSTKHQREKELHVV
jgi:hypothetical protein